jgi:DNA transposition AAA+ family ATPase
MRALTVKTMNVAMLYSAMNRIKTRGAAIPRIGIIYGPTGAGKTTALLAVAGLFDSIFVRAIAMGGASSLMDKLCFELGIEPPRFRAAKFDAIVAELRRNPRPVFIDEADYLCRSGEMLDMVRDLHDVANVAVFLIGMEGFEKHLAARHPQFASRVSEPLHFGACSLDDARMLAAELCEGVEIAPDLLAHVHSKAEGSVRLVVIALTLIEGYGQAYGLAKVDKKEWGEQPLFLGAHCQKPKTTKRGA